MAFDKRIAIGHLASAGAYAIFGVNVVVCRDIATDGGIAPHRCWLNVKGTAAARELSIGDGETTGIAAMEDAGSKVSDAWYSLDGRKFNAVPTRQGVYVNGGRKVVIK